MAPLIVALVLALFAIVVVASSVRIVRQARVGVVERWGKYRATLAPGLHRDGIGGGRTRRLPVPHRLTPRQSSKSAEVGRLGDPNAANPRPNSVGRCGPVDPFTM